MTTEQAVLDPDALAAARAVAETAPALTSQQRVQLAALLRLPRTSKAAEKAA